MKSFLYKTAEYIIQNHSDHLDKICVVLPNRRAGLFLKKRLAQVAGKTIWSPQIYSLSDFIISLSGKSIIDPVYLQFELYKIHQEIEGAQSQSFEEFLKWGRTLINDFNELDTYLIDTSQLYGYLSDEKAISLWNPENNALTNFQIRYLRFFQSFKTYYDKLSAFLEDKKEVYQGMAYRKVAKNIDAISDQLKCEKIIFAGFNAFTEAEKRIVFSLESSGKAILLWDTDAYYINNEIQEAGKFVRAFYNQTGKEKFRWIENSLRDSEKNVELIGVAQNVGQAKVAGQIIRQIAEKETEMNDTVLILNDESLFEPVLNSIPPEIEKFNLTMGLPLKSTPLYRLFDSIFELQINLLKFDRTNGKAPRFYYKDLLRIFDHPYIMQVLQADNLSEIPAKIRNSNQIFFNGDDFVEQYFNRETSSKAILLQFTKPWLEKPSFAVEKLLKIIAYFKVFFSNHDGVNSNADAKDLELEYLFHFNKIFQKLSNLLHEYPFILSIKELKSLYLQLVQIRLPFYGEPLYGLQIMGMLEAQTLDFRNIIMLSVNEDYLPGDKSINSFIPYEIRRKFLMPTYHESNAIYAYHFYRLIQRAENIFILYNSELGNLGGGDRSRFIEQMLYELPKYNQKIKFSQKLMSIAPESQKTSNSIVIVKTPEIISKLNEMADYGYSASALNTYRVCSLQFYFKYIAGIDEPDEPEETIEANTLGQVVHKVLEDFLKPFCGNKLIPEDLYQMTQHIDENIRSAFMKIFENGDIDYGKNFLIQKVAIQYVKNFLEKEIEDLKKVLSGGGFMLIKQIEPSFKSKISVNVKQQDLDIALSGRFDRIDEVSGILRIIDYKTGKVDAKDLKLNDWEDLIQDSHLDKCFQLLYYTYIYKSENKENVAPVVPGIISFRNLGSGFMTPKLPDTDTKTNEWINSFESILKRIMTAIYDTDSPFQQTQIVDDCKYCSFTRICNRN